MWAAASAQPLFFPLKELKPGTRAVGKTVFSGREIEEFQAEILGVLENIGPKQSLILARLSGGALGKTGVLQGMSGSPVYVDGRLVGAVAMAFPYATEPVAGIRPIEEMLRAGETRGPARASARISLTDANLASWLPKPAEVLVGKSRMVDIATPISFSGFTRDTVERFSPQLRVLGLEPCQGISGGGGTQRMGDPSNVKPGSMISVQLLRGDMSVSADGTVTHVDGRRIYAFGHRFLSTGATEIPFARAEVLTVLPMLTTSFKISAAREMLGTISQDRNSGISGDLGRRASLTPVSITVVDPGGKPNRYQIEMVNDGFLSPFLLQMAIFSAIDATERTLGASSYAVKGQIEFEGTVPPVRIDNMASGNFAAVLQASLSAAAPLAYVLQNDFESLKLKKITLDIGVFDEKKQMQIDQVFVSKREVRPGERLELMMVFVGENGLERTRKLDYQVPAGASPGTLAFTVADGISSNIAEIRQFIGTPPKSLAQLIDTVNQLRANTKAYVRVWRQDAAYQIEGADMPDPPPSASMILARSQATQGNLSQTRNSKVAEFVVDAGDSVVTGSKTVQVEIKE